jgi:diacylglycerol O-acyltransferase
VTHHRLSPLDVAFLHVEDRSNRMQLAGMLLFDGPAPSYAEFRDAIGRHLPSLPHFRQRLRYSPLGLTRPSWVDDDAFDLDYHLHRAALPAPGGHAEIAAHIDHMTAAPLDLQRPLWEMALIEGLENGGFALALKVHHCMVDGLSIIDIFAALCSPDPDHPLPEIREWSPRAPMSRWGRLRRSVSGLPKIPSRKAAAELVGWLRRASRMVGAAPSTRLNTGVSGPTRRTEYLTVPLRDIHEVRREFGTTVNNIVLSVVTGALHRYLGRHDELVEKVHAFVPVNRRPQEARGTHGNQIGMTYPALPVGETDPRERVRKVVTAVAASATARQAEDTEALIRLGRFMPQPLAAVANRAMQFEAGIFNLTVTNVPGPPVPVYFLGRELQLILGSTPLTRRHALTIAVLSYNGELTFSVTTDPHRVPDGPDLVQDIRNELAELRDLVPAQPTTARRQS